jgi:hypothetical protein
LEVDASQYATGAILYQKNEEGHLCPVGYHSHTLNEAECGYNIHDQELLAVIRGLRNWQHILLSSPHQMIVYTDHVNLTYYRQPQRINRRVARYLVDLAEYDFVLVHKPGKVNHADHLSWHPGYNMGMHGNEDVLVLPDCLFINAMQLGGLEAEVVEQQRDRPEINNWKTTWPIIKREGVLLHYGQVVVPEICALQ